MSSNGEDGVKEPPIDGPLIDETMYRSIFESMKEGMPIIRLLYDSNGKANDFIFLAVNAAHGKLTG